MKSEDARVALEKAKADLAYAEHEPFTDAQWHEARAAVEAHIDKWPGVCGPMLQAMSGVQAAVCTYLRELNNWNTRLLAEADYWKRRALEAEKPDA